MSKDLSEALRAMMEERRDTNVVPSPMSPRGGAEPVKSAALLQSGSAGKGGGIASPLTEVAYAARTWHTEKVIISTDGLFSLKIKPVKTIDFEDANAGAVKIEFKSPP